MTVNEARVTVNGKPLTTGQAMTLRVAVTSFAFQLKHDKAFAKALGPVAEPYTQRVDELLELLLEHAS